MQYLVLIVGFFIGLQGVAMLPLWLGVSIDAFQLSERVGGLLAMTQLGMSFLVSLFISTRIDRINKRISFLTGCALSIFGGIGSAIAAYVGSTELLFVCRGVGGGGEGLVIATICCLAAKSQNPVRAFASMNGGLAIIAACLFFLSPYLLESLGVIGIYVGMALTTTIGIFLALLIPKQSPEDNKSRVISRRSYQGGFSLHQWLSLLVFLLFTTISGGIWAFVERIGVSALSLDHSEIGKIIGIAISLMVIGPYLADTLSKRISWRAQFTWALLVYIGIALSFSIVDNVVIYAITTVMHTILSGYLGSVAPSFFAEYDQSGRVTSASPAFISLGNAFGPVLIAFSLTYFSDYTGIAWVSIPALTLCLIGFWYLTSLNAKRLKFLAEVF